jgi:hypothetical protein
MERGVVAVSEEIVVQPDVGTPDQREGADADTLVADVGVPSASGAPSVPSSIPYRTIPQEAPEPTPPRAWPVMGSSLWVFGVSMWAFLVMGELTTSYGPGKRDLLVGEGLAAVLVLGAGIAAWVYALRRMLDLQPARRVGRSAARAIAVAVLAFIMWFVVTTIATIVGDSSRKNLDGAITVTLMLLAAAAAFGGWWTTRARIGGSAGTRRAWWAIAIGAAVLTLVALIEVATD